MIKSSSSYFVQLVVFSVVLVIFKMLLLPLIHEIDADAVTRVYLSLDFAHNPTWIKAGNWPPLYFYLMGGALMLYENQFFTPVFVNILFSSLLLFPMYFALRRMFEEKISFLLCVFFSFSPIVFRLSMLAMSEIPYLFFVLLSSSFLLKGIQEKKSLLIVGAGLVMGIAGGIRYESWILTGLVVGYLIYLKMFKETFLFLIPSSVIPLFWVVSNYCYANDAFNSFNWAINLSPDRSVNSIDSVLRRIWWYPLSLLFAFGPAGFYLVIKSVKNYKLNKVTVFLVISFCLFFAIWLVNALRGSLLLQHRFSITLFLLLFTFLGFYFKKNPNRMYLKTIVLSATAFFCAFLYGSQGARPIPRLLTADAKEVSELINQNLEQSDGFICDFWNWETTYYLPFATGLIEKNIEIIDDKNSPIREVQSLLRKCKKGVVLVSKKNGLYPLLLKESGNYRLVSNDVNLKLEPIFENVAIICFKYKPLLR